MDNRNIAILEKLNRFIPMLQALWKRRLGFLLFALVAVLIPVSASAQDNSAQNLPVINPQPDINGVDVATAQYSVASPLSINAPAAGHLQVRSIFNGRRFTTNLEAYLTDDTLTEPDSGDPNSRQIRVHVDGVDRLFVCATIGLCQQVAKVDGARLTRTADKSYSFQGRDGTTVSFFPMNVNLMPICTGGGQGCNGANYGGYAYASSIAYANGERLTFANFPVVSGSTLVSTITSNLGYTVDAVYPCTSCTVASSPAGYGWVLYGGIANASTYILRKNGVELDRVSFSHTLTNFSGITPGQLAEQDDWKATDAIGRIFKIRLQSRNILTCQFFDGEYHNAQGVDQTNLNPVQVISPNGIETDIAYANVTVFTPELHYIPVASVTRGGQTWLYNFSESQGGGGTLTATDPLGHSQSRVAVGNLVPWQTAWGTIPAECFVSSTGSDITRSQDELGQQTNVAYQWQGTPSSATFPENNGYQYQHDGRGNITQITSVPKPGSGLTALITYQAGYDTVCSIPVKCNEPNWTKDANGGETDYEYDSVHGGETKATLPPDPTGVRPQRRSTYEAFDSGSGILYRLTQVSECMTLAACAGGSDEVTHSFTYLGNTFLRATETITSGGVSFTTSYTYDDAGRLTGETSPKGKTTTYVYDAVGRKTGTISADPDGSGPLQRIAQRITYNNDDQVTKIEDGIAADATAAALAVMTVSKVTNTTYNSIGQKTVEAVSSGGATYKLIQFSYDAAERLECTAVRMNPAEFGSLPSSACSLGVVGVYGSDRVTKNAYDAAGQLVQVRKAVGTADEEADVTYSYTPNGKQEYVLDANGNRAKMEYDGFDRKANWIFPSTTAPTAYNPSTQANALATAGSLNLTDSEAYGYDANGNRTSLRKRDGRTINYAYDALNRVMSKTYPSGGARPVYYSYDLRGLQTAARFDSATGTDAVTSIWNGFGEQTSSTTAMSGTSRTLGYQYDADGDRIDITHPDGVFFQYSWDGLDRLDTITNNGSANVIHIQYDPQGRMESVQRYLLSGVWGAPTVYSYDPVGRLAGLSIATANNPVSYGYNYNPANQIVSTTRDNDVYAFNGFVDVNRNYTSNGLSQYTAAGPASFSYDANGNLTSDGATSYGYDIENRLISTSAGWTLTYDPLGRLWKNQQGASNGTQMLFDGDKLVAEYDVTGTIQFSRFLNGDGEDESFGAFTGAGLANVNFFYADHQGSVIGIGHGAGDVTGINRYDEYGIPGAGNGGRLEYTGQIWLAEIGIYYYKARMYSPTLGRFMQTDPIGYADQNNLYSYVGNDPMNRTDPTGNYQRGEGFSDEEWIKFNKAQQAAGTAMLNRANKLDAKAAQRDASGRQGGDRMRAQAGNLRQGAIATSNTIFSPRANLLSDDAFNSARDSDVGCSGCSAKSNSAAYTLKSGLATLFRNGSQGIFDSNSVATSEWIIGHDSMHTILGGGLRDEKGPNGLPAYRYGLPGNVDAYRALQGKDVGAKSPDNLMGEVYP